MKSLPNQRHNQPVPMEKVSSTLDEINHNAAGIDLGKWGDINKWQTLYG